MRTTRLLAVMMDLSRAPRTTVQDLADRPGVSARTIQRDLAALGTMGVPVWTRTGPAGGVGLVDGWRSPVTGMTAAELQALIIGEAGSRDLGLIDDFETARLKMLSTTSVQSSAVGPAHERFLIDQERWFAAPDRPAALPAVARAVWAGRRVTVEYARPGGDRPVRRLLDPLGLVLKTDVWYLVAAHRRRARTYRLSRIVSASVHEEAGWRPPGFSLARYWAESRAAFEASVHTLPVRLSIPVTATDGLRAAVPGPRTAAGLEAARHIRDRTGERLEVELLMESPDIAAAQLLTVPGVEVLGPPELRAALFRRGEDLVARHRPDEEHRPGGAPDDAPGAG